MINTTEILRQLDWDSSFFKKKIGKAIIQDIGQFPEIKEAATAQQYDLVYLFSDGLMPVEVFGNPINTKVLYRRELTKVDLLKYPSDISIYKKDTLDKKLYELAYQAGHFSRFKLDVHFSVADFKHLYDQWMKKSLNSESMIFIYADKGQILGMTTLDFKSDYTQIGLIGVDENSRGKRIGKKLMDACLHYTIKHDLPCLDVFTQEENRTACRFYEACGFKEVYKNYIYHYWIDENTL